MKYCGTNYGYKLHRLNKEKPCDACRLAVNEYARLYRIKNLEKKREQGRNIYWKNPERYKLATSQWRQENRSKVKEDLKAWRDNNRDKYRAIQQRASGRRRAIKLNAPSELFSVQDVLEKWGTDCHICNEPIDLTAPRIKVPGWERGLHLDHVVPLSRGGADTLDNVKPAHGLCNAAKGATA